MSKKFKNRRPTSNPYANPPSSENISKGSAIGVPDTIAWGDMMISKDATPEVWQEYANRLQAGEKPPGGYPTANTSNLPAQRPALRGVPEGTIREPLFGRNKDGSPKPRPPGMTSEEVAALSAAQERKYNPPQKTTKASSAKSAKNAEMTRDFYDKAIPRTPPPAPNPSRSLLPPGTIPQTPEKQLLEYQARINSPKFAQLLPRQQETLKSRASALQEQISTNSTAPRPVPLLPRVPEQEWKPSLQEGMEIHRRANMGDSRAKDQLTRIKPENDPVIAAANKGDINARNQVQGDARSFLKPLSQTNPGQYSEPAPSPEKKAGTLIGAKFSRYSPEGDPIYDSAPGYSQEIVPSKRTTPVANLAKERDILMQAARQEQAAQMMQGPNKPGAAGLRLNEPTAKEKLAQFDAKYNPPSERDILLQAARQEQAASKSGGAGLRISGPTATEKLTEYDVQKKGKSLGYTGKDLDAYTQKELAIRKSEGEAKKQLAMRKSEEQTRKTASQIAKDPILNNAIWQGVNRGMSEDEAIKYAKKELAMFKPGQEKTIKANGPAPQSAVKYKEPPEFRANAGANWTKEAFDSMNAVNKYRADLAQQENMRRAGGIEIGKDEYGNPKYAMPVPKQAQQQSKTKPETQLKLKSAPARDMYGNEVKLDDMVLSGGMKGKLGSKQNKLSRASNVSSGGSTGTNTAKPTFRIIDGKVRSFGNTGGGGTTEETEPATGMR